MLNIKTISNIELLNALKHQYIEQLSGPLDGMWLAGFLPMAAHYGLYDGEALVGYFCVNDQNYLLQFYLDEQHKHQAEQMFKAILDADKSPAKIVGAHVSTLESEYLSLCFDHFPTSKAHTLMYQKTAECADNNSATSLPLSLVTEAQLSEVVNFVHTTIGAPEGWLTGYLGNLINRKELFGHWQNGTLIATGESRGYDDYQTNYGDLGMIVAESERGKGLATKVIKSLVTLTENKGLLPICSTEATNIGAQKALSRAGFYAYNRIIQFG